MSDSPKCVPKGSLVLVTGVTSFIGSHVALQLLQSGYKVRGTTRSAPKAEYLRDNPFEDYKDNFEIVIAKDLQEPDVFNDAVKGVHGIAHLASPIAFVGEDPWADFINPAVEGTKNLLVAARDYAGPQLRHIVITASAASIVDNGAHPPEISYTYTESDWNETSPRLVAELGKKSLVFDWYRASKTHAERYAWEFYNELKPSWGMSTIHPVYSFGPVLYKLETPKDANSSVGVIWKYFSGELKEVSKDSYASQCYVDVRDVAGCHVKCLTERGEEAAGQRFITCTGNFCWEDLVDVLRRNYPERVGKMAVPDMERSKKHHEGALSRFSHEKATKLLGVKFGYTFEESVLATARDLKRLL